MEKYRVLIVEDNADNLELVRFLLIRAGYEVFSGRDGHEGLNISRLEKPDLILMDLSLPGMDGWTAAKELKSDPQTDQIPLLAITAHTLPGDRKRAIDAGFDGYISKPIDVIHFGEIIQQAIRTKVNRGE